MLATFDGSNELKPIYLAVSVCVPEVGLNRTGKLLRL